MTPKPTEPIDELDQAIDKITYDFLFNVQVNRLTFRARDQAKAATKKLMQTHDKQLLDRAEKIIGKNSECLLPREERYLIEHIRYKAKNSLRDRQHADFAKLRKDLGL